jgi:hypothetical protein
MFLHEWHAVIKWEEIIKTYPALDGHVVLAAKRPHDGDGDEQDESCDGDGDDTGRGCEPRLVEGEVGKVIHQIAERPRPMVHGYTEDLLSSQLFISEAISSSGLRTYELYVFFTE